MKTIVRSVVLVSLLLFAAACGKSRDEASVAELTSATTAVTASSAVAGGEIAPPKRFVPSHTAQSFAGRFRRRLCPRKISRGSRSSVARARGRARRQERAGGAGVARHVDFPNESELQ